eukprot:4930596-Pleurochrysis_carterae.AAC.1
MEDGRSINREEEISGKGRRHGGFMQAERDVDCSAVQFRLHCACSLHPACRSSCVTLGASGQRPTARSSAASTALRM